MTDSRSSELPIAFENEYRELSCDVRSSTTFSRSSLNLLTASASAWFSWRVTNCRMTISPINSALSRNTPALTDPSSINSWNATSPKETRAMKYGPIADQGPVR